MVIIVKAQANNSRLSAGTKKKGGKNLQESPKIWYICDPQRAAECKKSGCIHNPESKYPVCYRTSHIEWAALDGKGRPILEKSPEFSEGVQDLL